MLCVFMLECGFCSNAFGSATELSRRFDTACGGGREVARSQRGQRTQPTQPVAQSSQSVSQSVSESESESVMSHDEIDVITFTRRST